MLITFGKTTSKLPILATSNYERDFPPVFYVENTKCSVYVESPHYFNIFFSESEVSVKTSANENAIEGFAFWMNPCLTYSE